MRADAPSSAELARRLLDSDAAVAPPADAAAAVALAWALKDQCYETWRTNPARAARAADVLSSLLGQLGPEIPAEALALHEWTQGIAQVTRGQLADAAQRLDAAQAAFLEAGLPDPAAQTQVPKIMVLSLLGQYNEAIDCAEATQRTLRSLGNLQAAARVSLNLAGLLLRRHAYAESARHCREAAVLFARVGDHEHSIGADIGLADALAMLGDFDQALRYYDRARQRAGNRGFETVLALVDESVALVDLARGRYREALAGLESARRRYEALAMPQYLAVAEKQLADAYLELRLLPEALKLFEAAVTQFAALELPDEQAWALTQSGRARQLLGQASAAATAFADAAVLFQQQDNPVGQAAVDLARAELSLSTGDEASALGHAEQAARGFAAVAQADGQLRAEVVRAQALLELGDTETAHAAFTDLLARSRTTRQLQVQVRCLTGQGLASQATGDADTARVSFEAAIELFEDQRRALPGDEIRSAFLTDHLRPFEERLRMALAGGRGDDTLLQLDRFRARALGERLAAGPDTARRRERLNWLYRRLQRLQEEAGSAPALHEELLRTEHELLEQVRRERLAEPAGEAGSDSFRPEDLQAELQPGDAVVAYGVLDDELFACVVTPEGVRLQRHLARWSTVQEAIRAARFQIDSLSRGASALAPHLATLTRRCQTRLQQLHDLIWAPLAPALAACRRVLVVPHGALGWVPFAALHDGRSAVGTRYSLAMAPSARIALRGLHRQPAPARVALALGASTQLPHAALEATRVASLFAQGEAFVGDQATLETLRARASGADVLHLACHAQFRADNPRFSALHLHDGLLTVDLAEALDLGPCTVVLGACETGLGEIGAGDEVVGLVRAFLVAGAARVLASLWPVDDEVTAGFMAAFYGGLAAGQAPAEALRAAQERVFRTHPHPHFWGAFALYGGF